MVKRKFEFGLSNGFCTTGGAISGEKKELSCQVTRNMGKLPLYRDKCHILRQCHKIIVTHNNNMDNNKIVCPHCGKNNFKCSRGLTQHLTNAAYCSQAEKEKKDKEDGYFTAPETITFGDNYWQMHHNKLAKRAKQTDDRRLARCEQIKELAKYVSKEFSASGTKLGVEEENYHTAAEYGSDEDDGMDLSTGSNVNFEENDVNSENSNNGHVEDVTLPPDNTIKSKFEAYCLRAQHFLPLQGRYVAAIELMFILRKTKASLDTYESMMRWHFETTGKLKKGQPLSSIPEYVSRKRLFGYLRKRYNMTEGWGIVKEITLSSTKQRVKIVTNDFISVAQHLLTNPRIKWEDYLWFDDDPLAGPPDNLDYVADINTGRAYTETYRRLIKNPDKQILMGVQFYMDAAVTGQFANLPVTAVRCAFTIFNRRAREQDYFWGTLGYVPNYRKEISRGNRMFAESGHVDAIFCQAEDLEAGQVKAKKKAIKPQDLHEILDVVLESYIKIQDTGFYWDLRYKKKVYENIEFVLFTPNLRVDTDEANKLCGHYSSRTSGVRNLCRYCTVPTLKSDLVTKNWEHKTVRMVKKLVDAEDFAGLRAISQQYIENALYRIRFGLHNGRGIHGATPLEMLHAILLGMFKYMNECFFVQIGKTSQLADDINALAQKYGKLLHRQSDRDMPKTKFSKGIHKGGKIMAKEYTGVLLIMATILRSTMGRRLLSQNKTYFGPTQLRDWTMLVETLLEWEAWLKSDRMELEHVEAAKQKHRYIMYLIKKVGNRVKGMGLKLMKFHGIMHMYMDIIHFGVPMEFDTGTNESGHKRTKKAALLTQKREDTFPEITLLQRCVKRTIKTRIPDETDPQYAKRVLNCQCICMVGRQSFACCMPRFTSFCTRQADVHPSFEVCPRR
jgi:hypothetical protein